MSTRTSLSTVDNKVLFIIRARGVVIDHHFDTSRYTMYTTETSLREPLMNCGIINYPSCEPCSDVHIPIGQSLRESVFKVSKRFIIGTSESCGVGNNGIESSSDQSPQNMATKKSGSFTQDLERRD